MRSSGENREGFEKDRVDLLADLNEVVEGAPTKFVRVRINSLDRQDWSGLAVNAKAEMNARGRRGVWGEKGVL